MDGRVSDLYRTAFVTGAGSGLGKAFAEMLAQDGVSVWATSRKPERLAPLVAAAAGRIKPLALDLADPSGAEAAFRRASEEAGGTVDLLVNNAGYGIFGPFASVPAEQWEAQIAALIQTPLRLAHAAWRGWIDGWRGGCLVNVSSIALEFPIPYMPGYVAGKAALSALSETLMMEAAGRGIVIVDFRPGDYRTEFNRAMEAGSPAGREGAAADVWASVEAAMAAAPVPARAAADLKRALLRRVSGTVRSGSLFQARLAPFLARFAPLSLRRSASARYFGLR
jgi:NAD(P)-dependent dehydrogenase (short-subunit alcohol dehydrogenase family)